jgi:hypothetical protein
MWLGILFLAQPPQTNWRKFLACHISHAHLTNLKFCQVGHRSQGVTNWMKFDSIPWFYLISRLLTVECLWMGNLPDFSHTFVFNCHSSRLCHSSALPDLFIDFKYNHNIWSHFPISFPSCSPWPIMWHPVWLPHVWIYHTDYVILSAGLYCQLLLCIAFPG